MCTSMSGRIKVKCIKENKYGLIIGKIYDAYKIQSAFKNKENIISVIDGYNEEYAYPADFFEIVEE